MKTYKSVNEYIRAVDADKRAHINAVRAAVKKAAPNAVESIAYGMPAYVWKDKPLFYFAAMKGHLGLYPTPGPITTLSKLLTGYSTSKGCIRVPYSEKVPTTLIAKLIKERMREIRTKEKASR